LKTDTLIGLRVDDRTIQTWLDRLNSNTLSPTQLDRRLLPRLECRQLMLVLEPMDSDNAGARYQVAGRNLSREGLGLLAGRFFFPQTPCRLMLTDSLGRRGTLGGRVTRCRYLTGSATLYEVGVKFDQPIGAGHAQSVSQVQQSGHELVGYQFIPVDSEYTVQVATSDGWVMSFGRMGQPCTAAEAEAVRADLERIDKLRRVGEGRLVRLLEGRGPTGTDVRVLYEVAYALRDDEALIITHDALSAEQAQYMQIEELLARYNAGEGKVVSYRDHPMGLGFYRIHFALTDGHAVELETMFPPGLRKEREAIMAETWELRARGRFVVHNPSADSDGSAYGLLQYTLKDGRTVGLVEELPPELLSADGQYLMLPDLERPIELEGAAEGRS
jgi:hypothetical protein